MSIFAGFFRKKPDSGSGKPDTRFRNLFVLKYIWVKVTITWDFQPNWSKNTLKSGFFRISGKSGSRIRNFFSLKPSRDQGGANKKKFSQISPAVPELWGNSQTDKHTYIQRSYYFQVRMKHKTMNLKRIHGVFQNTENFWNSYCTQRSLRPYKA